MSEKEWEDIIAEEYSTLRRVKVPGGWIYKSIDWENVETSFSSALVFVPDGSCSKVVRYWKPTCN